MGISSVEAKRDIGKIEKEFGVIVLPGEPLNGWLEGDLAGELKAITEQTFGGRGMVRLYRGVPIFYSNDGLPLASHLSAKDQEEITRLMSRANARRIVSEIEEDHRFH